MEIKTIQWNLGGGMDAEDLSKNVLQRIIDLLRKENLDIIMFQEAHSDKTSSQAEYISKELGYKYFVNDPYDESHIEKGQMLSQVVISRYPISKHQFTFFNNPKLTAQQPNGDIWITHDRGITTCEIDIGGQNLTVQTLHVLPFKRFNVNPLNEDSEAIRAEVSRVISKETPLLVQGDFNMNDVSLKPFLGDIFESNMQEVLNDQPTYMAGYIYDHVLYRGLKEISHVVIKEVPTDHYPLVTSFVV